MPRPTPVRARPRSFPAPVVLSVALSVAVCVAAAGADDWPQWRGPDRAGAAAGPPLIAEAPPAGLVPVWAVDLSEATGESVDGGWASPVVADGRVFLAVAGRVKKGGVELPEPKFPDLTDEQEAALSPEALAEYTRNRREESLERRKAAFTGREALHAFDAATGERLWTDARDAPVTRFPQSSTPAVAGDLIVRLSGDRVLRAANAADGAARWETRLPGEFDSEQISSSPAVRDGRIYLLAGRLFAVNLADGAVVWENPEVAGTHSSPAVWGNEAGDGGAVVVVNVDDGATVGVDAADGRELWRLTDTGAARSSPVLAGDRLLTFGGSRKGGLRCYELSRDEPKPLWKYQKLSDPGASPVVGGGLVLAAGDRRLDCVNLEDGAPRWTTRLDLANPRYTSPVAVLNDDGGGAGLYTFGRVLAFDWTGEAFRPRFDLAAGPGGLAKTEARWREELNLTADAPEDAKRFDREVTRRGLLPCASPAVVGGRVYLRLNGRLACYELAE